jgi:hypothetical protein
VSTLARAEFWQTAQALSAAAGPQLSPRARRLSVKNDPAITLDDLSTAPAWLHASDEVRTRLAILSGAAACSGAWRRSIDGATLRHVAEAVGEAALDALLALPEIMTPGVADAAAESGDAGALKRLGAAVLLAGGDYPASLRPRLEALFDAEPLAALHRETAATVQRTAEALVAQTAVRA